MNIRPEGGKTIRPSEDGYFTGREQVPAKGVEEKTPLGGRKRESIRSWLTRGVKRMAFIVRHPKAALRQRRQDRDMLKREAESGKMEDARYLKDRKISRDLHHLQSVTKKMHSDISADKRMGAFDPMADEIDELEHVQKIRVGFEDDAPGMSKPKTDKDREKLKKLRKVFEGEQEKRAERNASVAGLIEGLKNKPEKMSSLEAEIEDSRRQHNEIIGLLVQMDDLDTDTIITDENLRKSRQELNDELAQLKSKVVSKRKELAALRAEHSLRTDEERETKEVMNAVHKSMDEWMQTSDKEYEELIRVLKRFPSIAEKLGGEDDVAMMAKGDQLKRFRVEDIGKLEQSFIDAKGDESVEKEVGMDIYAKRLMAMRMDEMIRGAETSEALQDSVDQYLGKKPEPQLSSRLSYLATEETLDNWGKGDWVNPGDDDDEEFFDAEDDSNVQSS